MLRKLELSNSADEISGSFNLKERTLNLPFSIYMTCKLSESSFLFSTGGNIVDSVKMINDAQSDLKALVVEF